MLFTKNYLPKFNTYEDFRNAAKKKLPKMVFDFVDGGADSEISLRANRKAFENNYRDGEYRLHEQSPESNIRVSIVHRSSERKHCRESGVHPCSDQRPTHPQS